MTIQDVLTDLGIPFANAGEHHHVSTGFVGIDCPRCSPGESKFKLGIRTSTLRPTCWSCGGVRLVDALVESGVPFPRVRAVLDALGAAGRDFPDAKRDLTTSATLRVPAGVGGLLPAHERYLIGRGFDPETVVKLWGVRGIGPAPRLAWRLFIPIRTGGKTVSWTARSIAPNAALRYINAGKDEEAVPAKSILYGAELAGHAIIVGEGCTDAWRIGPGGTATMGVVYSREQVLAISLFPLRVIAFDNEPEAQQRAIRLCRELEAFPGTTKRVEIDAPDLGSASRREIKLLRRSFLR